MRKSLIFWEICLTGMKDEHKSPKNRNGRGRPLDVAPASGRWCRVECHTRGETLAERDAMLEAAQAPGRRRCDYRLPGEHRPARGRPESSCVRASPVQCALGQNRGQL